MYIAVQCHHRSRRACARRRPGVFGGDGLSPLGCEPQCGKCVPFVRQMLRQADAATAAQHAGGDD